MFGGFKASLNFFGKKNKKDLHSELTPDMCVSGAYRTSRDDFFGYRNSFDQSKKVTPPEVSQQIRPTKSTNDLMTTKTLNPNIRHSNEVSRDPRGAEQVDARNGPQGQNDSRHQDKEQKKIQKQRLAEQKMREKQAIQEQKLRKEKERKDLQQSKTNKDKKSGKKNVAPPPPNPPANIAQTSAPYSTNTLESSISRSSGPPPYSDVPAPKPNQNRTAPNINIKGNVAFSKPVDMGSWDIISQHREQIIKPTAKIGGNGKQSKQTVMDLNYNFEAPSTATNNSEA